MKLTVGITTWIRYVERFEYLCMVINSLKHRLPGSTTYEIEWVIAAETNGIASHDLQNAFMAYCREHEVKVVPNTERPCLGTNMNNLINACKTDYLLYVPDDFLIQNSPPLGADLRFLADNLDYGMIRYSWPRRSDGHHESQLGEDAQPLRVLTPGMPHYFAFSPFLARRSYFTDLAGMFAETPSAEWQMNVAAKRTVQEKEGAKILGRGAGLSDDANQQFFVHVGDKTSMTEKYAAMSITAE